MDGDAVVLLPYCLCAAAAAAAAVAATAAANEVKKPNLPFSRPYNIKKGRTIYMHDKETDFCSV